MSPFFNVIGLFHIDNTIEHRNIEIWNSGILQIIITLKFSFIRWVDQNLQSLWICARDKLFNQTFSLPRTYW